MSTPLPAGSRETYTVPGLAINIVYFFALKTADDVGNWSAMSNVWAQWSTAAIGVGDPPGPQVLQFSAPHPNPARGTTAFVMGLPSTQDVHIAAYDVQGRIVKTLLSGTRPAGTLRLVWNLDDSDSRPVSTGVYLIRARLGTEWLERRVAVVR